MILNGWRVGEVQWGGYAERARVKAEWLGAAARGVSTTRRGDGDRHRRAIPLMLCVMALEQHGVTPDAGEVAVTGAAAASAPSPSRSWPRLAIASWPRPAAPRRATYLKGPGATTIIDRKELFEAPNRPLLGERFAGAVDTVSGATLARALAQVKYRGAAAVCGLAAHRPSGHDPPLHPPRRLATASIGDAAAGPAPRGLEAPRYLDLPLDKLDSTVSEVGSGDLMGLAPKILRGEVRGRVVIDVNG